MDRDGRREIALLGHGTDWTNLFSEILKAHGFPCRIVSDLDQIRSWTDGKRGGWLIAEADPYGRMAGLIRGIQNAFPEIRVISLPSDFRPSELVFLVNTALSAWDGFQRGGVACAISSRS